jgi:uncharacterized protein YdeI (YjbR/CyaY-like superfamily)
MTKHATNPRVDAFFTSATRWREEMRQLRTILLACGLDEDLKWSKPCYAFQGGNVVVIQPFKAYCALLFFKGVLLKDPAGILVKTGENTRVGRQIRFTDARQIAAQESVLKSYVRQAIDLEKSGAKVELENAPEPTLPVELKNKLAKNSALKKAFAALTPGRQRAYIFFFSAPKQSKTRESRIDKYTPQILKGQGMYDDYVSAKKK